MASNDATARSGSRLTMARPASACTTIVETEWAITSCSSRAIRLRSSATANSFPLGLGSLELAGLVPNLGD